ncbi:MAG: TldD/PmbA family protein [Alphaproteobacteria bacterium]|nr:TldD/PmbA family protein [Alphaproteobacteria bacterium]
MPGADAVAHAIERARARGADAADAVAFEGSSLSAAYRMGEIEDLERSEGRDLGLRVFLGRRQAFVSSNDWSPGGLDGLAERALAMARVTPEDRYCGLADPERLARVLPALDLDDGDEPSAERLLAAAREAEASALSIPGIVNSQGGSASWGRSVAYLATSHGFSGSYSASHHSIACTVLAGEGEAMERDYESSLACHAADLAAPETVGRAAAERALRRLRPRRIRTARVPVIFDPRVGRSLVGHLLGAIAGSAVARGTSFLKNRMGEAVLAGGLTVIDDPHRPRGLGSRPFDGEGVATARMALVEDGILRTWLLDSASARQLGLATTGHATRGTGGPPGPGASNVHLAAGACTPSELIADIEAGLYVTDLIGMGVNGVTGDYSRGAAGLWIEEGELAYPVNEVTIAGNLKDMFRALTAANDLDFRYAVNVPTLRVDGMTVAGPGEA